MSYKKLSNILAVFMLAGWASFSQAIPITTYDFSGSCLDCLQAPEAVTGTLVVNGDHPTQPLTEFDFVSFTYSGSSLLAPVMRQKQMPTGTIRVVIGLLDGTVAVMTGLHPREATIVSIQWPGHGQRIALGEVLYRLPLWGQLLVAVSVGQDVPL